MPGLPFGKGRVLNGKNLSHKDNKGMTHMKSLVFLLLALIFLFVTNANTLAEVTAAFIPPVPGEHMSLERDIGLLLKGAWYPILTDTQTLREALGEPAALNAAPSCVFVGEDKEFVYEGLTFFTNPVGDQDIWFEAQLTSNAYATSRGIRVGDTLDMLKEAYGDRCYWEGETILTYSVSGIEGDYVSPCIMFEIVDDVIASIDIYYPTNVTEPTAS
jgi:hypothetical protein